MSRHTTAYSARVRAEELDRLWDCMEDLEEELDDVEEEMEDAEDGPEAEAAPEWSRQLVAKLLGLKDWLGKLGHLFQCRFAGKHCTDDPHPPPSGRISPPAIAPTRQGGFNPKSTCFRKCFFWRSLVSFSKCPLCPK
ncbi:MAG: hypothetical protein WDA00_02380 [Eubacteriales bacterium]